MTLPEIEATGCKNAGLAKIHPATVALPGGDTARSLIPPVTAGSYEPVMGPVPALGADTERVLKEFGLS